MNELRPRPQTTLTAARRSPIPQIAAMQDVLDRWRGLGHRRLRTGAELIGRAPVDDAEAWLHVLFPPATAARLDQLEAQLRRPLPRDLRCLYRCVGGMSLFAGAFVLCGPSSPYVQVGDGALQPGSLHGLGHELASLPWLDAGMLPFAINAWDLSVHVYGHADAAPDEVVRLDRQDGSVRERHADVWSCLADRLTRLDQLLLG